MLSPNGMLGPIRALKQLHLIHIPLSDESQSDYCTAHLRYHRHLENLAIEDSNLPQDFVELMVKPLSASNALLPNLKRLDFGWYRLINPPSTDWFTALAKARPSLVVIYRGDLLFPWSKIDAFERPEH
ncbi:hypothetical protein CPB86DRAFT_789109 [Serendipita vermifera]|nr:hypothetical protein CPB86DRAFT_789109 [Serendipita vermifera]